MDASFGTTPLAMQKAIRLMESELVDPEKIISHRFALQDISPGRGSDGTARTQQGDDPSMKAIVNTAARDVWSGRTGPGRSPARARFGSAPPLAESAPPTWR